MPLNLTNYDAALKQHYTRDRILSMVYSDHPFLAMVEKKTNAGGRNIPLPIHYGNPQGRSATFATAQANKGNSLVEDFVLTRAKDYSLASIDGETIEATKGDVNAFMEAMAFEVDNAIDTIKASLATAMFRSGTGTIGRISAGSNVATTTITLADPKDVANFEKGMKISSSSGDGSGLRDSGDAVTLLSVDRDAGTLTADAAWSTTIAGCAASDYLLVQGDLNGKIKGLLAWLPATAPSGGDSFFGVDRSVDTVRLAGVRYDGSAETIDDALIKGAMNVGKHGGKPKVAFVSFDKYADLELALGPKVRYENVETPNVEVGFRAIVISGPRGPIKVVPDLNCPNSYAFMLDPETWKLYSVGDAPHILDHDGRTSLRESSSDGVEVRIGYYAQLGCRAPGKNGIITLP